MVSDFIAFCPPAVGEDEIESVAQTLRSGWITTGPRTKEFEKKFAHFVDAPAALALSSCTAALHTSLVTLGIGEADEVITTPMTFASTVSVIEHTRARPVLVDVEPDTLNVDPAQIERAISKKTKAIIAVHYSGHPAEMDAIWDLARTHGIQVIEDAAHAFPARYRGRFIGASQNPVAFSFYATKNLTTGEGGMLTASADFLERARKIAHHGMDGDAWKRYQKEGSWYYEIVTPGFKYNMTDVQAAMGSCQLEKMASFQQRRKEIVQAYNDAFSRLEAIETPQCRPHVESSFHLYVLRLKLEMLSIGRDGFIEELKIRKVGTSVHFIPIHVHPYYRDRYGYREKDFPVAFSNFQRMLSLPLHPSLTASQVSWITETVADLVKKFKR